MTRSRALRLIAGAVGVAGLVAGVAALAAFRSGASNNIVIVLASLAPLLLLATVVGAIVSAVARQWLLLAAAVVVVGLGGWAYGPLYVAGASGEPVVDENGPSIRVMQSNIMVGSADPEALVRMVRERDIDVLTIQELTDPSVEALRKAGLEDLLPHQVLAPHTTGGGGGGIYSRLPLSNGRQVEGMALTNLVAEVDAGLGRPVILYDVHPVPAYIAPAAHWTEDFDRLRADMDSSAAHDNVIVSGDFNATYSHSKFRDLRHGGYVDAADQLGAGILPTYPTDKRYPAVVGIDHILTKGATATSFERIDVAGSDHHGLVADVRLTTGS
ncbi:endonuclease/exonuclease/phosphatase (EEP) superfamily protein YafD [Rhodococcus sp. AG1013]|uniref:endonuclease/exonuclease/phosphatase family protein n=1 Tax=Rhodococcus sp. AG1013 TaxID=2183996 RepID=UPI000E0BF2A5|nr:endonuclease/exonuclease/phosphatase family protein [Rhodococcus sp. AG1013]RDI34034.1 endonuclease/exonuclease/phosphatase (EEP) superfamily protein YafD [Rhodococcus sp. AG1013]